MKVMDFSSVNILLLGDIMLDRFEYGRVNRISPEAPVPVFSPTQTQEMLGGVGNVAANLSDLGCHVNLITCLGTDKSGQVVQQLLKHSGAHVQFITPYAYPTTVKTRLIAGNNHLLRIDQEEIVPLTTPDVTQVFRFYTAHLVQANVVILSDYGKGFLTKQLCSKIINAAKKSRTPIIVDPKGSNYAKYAGATLIKPNLKEFSEVTGRHFDPHDDNFQKQVVDAAKDLIAQYDFGGLLITLSEHGMLYVPAKETEAVVRLPTEAREVFDVSGAGDTSLAALGAAIGIGVSIAEAMKIANVASGIVVSKLGTATVSLKELNKALSTEMFDETEAKIVSQSDIHSLCALLKQQGKRIGFTNGCFDCCHLGHLSSLRDAKKFCDVLVVGLNSDAWIRAHKGPDRPIQDEQTRAYLLASLAMVDYVVLFDDETALPLVRKIRPDIIAKEGYTMDHWPEGRFVQEYGGEAVVLKRVEGYSTTSLVKNLMGVS